MQTQSRSIWSGMLSVGMLNIPVKMYACTAERESLKSLCPKCKGELSQKKMCYVCDPNGRVLGDEEKPLKKYRSRQHGT